MQLYQSRKAFSDPNFLPLITPIMQKLEESWWVRRKNRGRKWASDEETTMHSAPAPLRGLSRRQVQAGDEEKL